MQFIGNSFVRVLLFYFYNAHCHVRKNVLCNVCTQGNCVVMCRIARCNCRVCTLMKASFNYQVNLASLYISNHSLCTITSAVDSELSSRECMQTLLACGVAIWYSFNSTRKVFPNNNAGTFVYISQKAVRQCKEWRCGVERRSPTPFPPPPGILKNKTKLYRFVSVPQHSHFEDLVLSLSVGPHS